jgi:uncharacterized protein (TIGR00369 family)
MTDPTPRNPEWDLALSNFNRHLRMTILDWTPGQATVALDMDEWMRNRHGTLHGGSIATLIDATGGYAGVFCAVPGNVRMQATLSLTVNFLAPGKGPRVIARGEICGGGKRIYNARVEVNDSDGTPIAIGQAVYQYLPGSENPDGVPRK